MTIRVLYANPTADMYGASQSLLRLISSLDKRDYEPFVALPEEGPLADLLRKRDVSVYVLPYFPVIRRRVLQSWRVVPFILAIIPYVLYLVYLIQRKKIDLVHTNSGVVFASAIAAKLSGASHVWHLREMFIDEFGTLWRFYRKAMLYLSNEVFCVSQPIADQFSSNPKVAVVYNGINISEYSVTEDAVAEVVEHYRLSTTSVLIGVVGRISPRKGQDVLLRACATLYENGRRGFHCLIVGDVFTGNEYVMNQLESLIEEKNLASHVTLTGFIRDPRPIIAALDILVLPSVLPEAFPGIVLEGMALEVPVIATSTGGTVEQIEHGVSGLLVPPGDVKAISAAVERLMDDPYLADQLRSGGRERVESKFSLEAMLKYTLSVYADLTE